MIRALVLMGIVAGVMNAGLVSTALAEPSDEQRQAMEMKVQELRERLALTPEQEQKIAPILEERNEKLRALAAKRDPNASFREKRATMSEAKGIQEEFTRRIEPILTQEQIKEWEAFRKEARAKARERYRQR